MRYAQPPMEPPTRWVRNCPDCDGDGFTIVFLEDGTIEDVTCLDCDGDGEIDFDPSDNPYAPDTWKEAEGIA